MGIDSSSAQPREMLAGAYDPAALKAFEISSGQPGYFSGEVPKIPSLQAIIDGVVECEVKDGGEVDVEAQSAQAFGSDFAQASRDGSVLSGSEEIG
jgi:hypothetical protein